jgi:hypothetical protein
VRAWDKTSVNKLGQQKVFYNVGLLGLQLLLLQLLCAKLEVEIKKDNLFRFLFFSGHFMPLWLLRQKERKVFYSNSFQFD